MMKHWIGVALLGCALAANAQTASPAKKELVAKVLELQQPAVEALARTVVQRPVMQLMQAAGQTLRTQVPADKREAVGNTIEADAKQFVAEAEPLLRKRAIELAPSVIGPVLEEKFSEDELKQLVAWLESPVNKKYQQIAPEMEGAFVKKLLAEGAPLLDPKLQALHQKMRKALGVADAPAAGKAPAPARAASR
jgi:hypothetical protein